MRAIPQVILDHRSKNVNKRKSLRVTNIILKRSSHSGRAFFIDIHRYPILR